jgi:hypothetical protein
MRPYRIADDIEPRQQSNDGCPQTMRLHIRVQGLLSNSGTAGRNLLEEIVMGDLVFVVATIAFFFLAIGYVQFCGKVR